MADTTKIGKVEYDVGLDSSGMKKDQKEVKGLLDQLKSGFKGLNPVVAELGAAFGLVLGAKATIDFFKESIAAASESQRVMTQTEAVIRSTGMAAGLTAEEVGKMAKAIQASTPISDEAAQSGMNMLLTFTKIGKDVFPDATQAMIDMATAMNGGVTPGAEELRGTAIQLGKALQDPVLGMTALRRVGVNFTESQDKMVKAMMENGHQMEAQRFILRELATEFGGSAKAQAETFEGQITSLRNTFNDFQEDVGRSVIPTLQYLISAFTGVGGSLDLILTPIRLVSQGFLSLIFIARELGIAIGTALASIGAFMQGGVSLMSLTWKEGMKTMTDEGVNFQNRLNQIWGKAGDKRLDMLKQQLKDAEGASSGSGSKIAKQMADETEDYIRQLDKRKKAFEQNMADIIWSHQDKVKQIKNDLSDENKSFKDQMDERVKSFKESMAEMLDSHNENISDIKSDMTDLTDSFNADNQERADDAQTSLDEEKKAYEEKTSSIQKLLDREISRGKNGSKSKIAMYQEELAEAKLAYEEKTNSIISQLDKENAKTKEAFDKKMADYQISIDQENAKYAAEVAKKTADDAAETERLAKVHSDRINELDTSLKAEQKILGSHQALVDGIKDKARKDDIQRLLDQYNDENAEASRQHDKRMADLAEQGGAEGTEYVQNMKKAIEEQEAELAAQTKKTGDVAGESMKNGLVTWAPIAAQAFVGDWKGAISSLFPVAMKEVLTSIFGKETARSIGKFLHIPGFAKGVKDFGGGLAMVGEDGPELVRLPRGADVIPNDQINNTPGTQQTIYINIDKVSSMQDVQSIGRELGFRAGLTPQ